MVRGKKAVAYLLLDDGRSSNAKIKKVWQYYYGQALKEK